jgi:uncharacterized protein
MLSCIYKGNVRHQRLNPVAHQFRYGLYMMYLDLEELPTMLSAGCGLYRSRFSPASFRYTDHFDRQPQSLTETVRNLVKEQTGWQPTGPVRLLTLLRNFGYYFNPLSLYYCFESSGQSLEAIVAEVTNTPWHERHWYILWKGNQIGGHHRLHFRHPKDFHVSPFMDMNAEYEWRLNNPGKRLNVSIVSSREGRRIFDVSLVLRRYELTRTALLRTMFSYPWMTLRVSQAIYWQALRLWWKKCPFYPHPKNLKGPEARQP